MLTHTFAVVANVQPQERLDERAFRITRLAALFHDIGKPRTRAFGDKGVSFHHHEVVGARMTRQRLQALRYSNDDIDDITQLVFLHLRFHTYQMGWTDAAVRRFVRDAGDLLDELIVLTRCDCTTRNKRRAETLARRMDELEARVEELREAEELEGAAPRARRSAGHGAAGGRARAGWWGRRWTTCSSCGSRRACWARTRCAAGSTSGGQRPLASG